MNCPNCGVDNTPKKKFCKICGQSLAQATTRQTIKLTQQDSVTRKITQSASHRLAEKRSPRSGDTQKLPAQQPFLPLPEGAIVGSYVVVRQYQQSSPEQHLYQVRSEKPLLICSQCGSKGNSADKKFCTQCGSDLHNEQPTYPNYLLTEALKPQIIGGAYKMTKLPIHVAGVRLPLASLQHPVHNQERYYLVSDLTGLPLSKQKLPVKPSQVVKWGATLAYALAELQRHNICWPQLTPQHFMVEREQVYFAGFTDATQNGASPANVSQLAAILNWLLTGKNKHTLHPNLSDNLNGMLKRAMTRAAPVSASDLAAAFEQEGGGHRPMNVKLQMGKITDVGIVRQLNEDNMWTLQTTYNDRSHKRPIGIYVVADGMGGHEGGEVASQMTVDRIGQLASQQLLSKMAGGQTAVDYENWLKQAIQAANKEVYEMAKASYNDMGTTVVAAVVVNNEVYIGHAGDSRAYRINANGIKQLTTDHSLVERLVATGQIRREEARHHPQGNVVYRTIGDKPKIEVDTMYTRLAVDDCLLLCSDGLTGMVTDDHIQKTVRESTSPQSACDALIHAANAAGGTDNITAVIVKVEG